MKYIFVLLLFCFNLFAVPEPKVYDCFNFFNELDILDIRLHELNDVVDKFVLIESVETFTGKSKPLFYNDNKERFKKFEDKIIHIIIRARKTSGLLFFSTLPSRCLRLLAASSRTVSPSSPMRCTTSVTASLLA